MNLREKKTLQNSENRASDGSRVAAALSVCELLADAASEGLASSIFSNAAGLIQTLADSIHHNNAPISNLSQIIIKGNRKS